MFDRRLAWFAVGGFLLAGTIASEGCSGADNTDDGTSSAGDGLCGNGIKEGTEQCDDGNAVEDDGCTSQCASTCNGNGIVDAGEECDDGDDIDNNACSNNCTANSEFCGNGVTEDAEQCDDGNAVTDDECTNFCTTPRCGDGIVQAGEDCDEGDGEFVNCPPDCMGGGGMGGNPCNGQATYAGAVTNSTTPAQPGPGIGSVWSYGGELGTEAGHDMCAAIGADHVCSFRELLIADAAGELTADPDLVDQEFWIHRTSMNVPRLSEVGDSPPGPGARCNEWTYPTNHISDSEFGILSTDPVAMPPAFAQVFGNIWAVTDDDAGYEPALDSDSPGGTPATDNPDGNPTIIGGDHECGSGVNSFTGSTVPGCGGQCASATAKAILCCFPTCE